MMDKYILTPPVTMINKKRVVSKKKNSPNKKPPIKIPNFDVEFFSYNYENDEIINPKIKLNKRALLVCAMLRCMHAAIEYAPEESFRQNSIAQINQPKIILMLTQLCASTGWVRGNVGSKYLKIIYYGLKLSNKEFNETKENFEIYELVSKAIYEMLQIVRRKLFQEDKVPLNQEDKMLVFDLAKTTSCLITQVPNITWVTNNPISFAKHGSLYRTPQEKCIELCLLRLFPRNILKTFIDVILGEMKSSSELSNEIIKDQKTLNMKKSIRIHILNILGTFISKCKDQKYEIIDQFSRVINFINKYN